MRLRSICVHVDFNPQNPLKLRARCFQYEGKTEIVWGRAICLLAKTTQDVERAVWREFSKRVRAVWMTWDENLERTNGFICFDPSMRAEIETEKLKGPTGPDEFEVFGGIAKT